ncbi:MAG: TolC family protein [Candidatus Hydrogenedentales bacterium]
MPKMLLLLFCLLITPFLMAQPAPMEIDTLPDLGAPPPGDISQLNFSHDTRIVTEEAEDISPDENLDSEEELTSEEDTDPIQAGDDGAEVESKENAATHTASDTEENNAIQILDLVTAQRRALAQNPSLAAGAERVEKTKQLVAKARSLYFPQIDLSYRYTFTWLPSDYVDPINELLDETEDVISSVRRQLYLYYATTRGVTLSNRRTVRNYFNNVNSLVDTARDYVDNPLENATANLTAGWLLFDGFAREYLNAMAKHGYSEAQASYRDGQRILIDAVAQAYYGGQYAREQIVIAEAAIVFFERLVKEAEARRTIGRGPTSHVLNFQTALYAAKGNLLKAQREHELARIALAVLMGSHEAYLPDTIQLDRLETEQEETKTLPDGDAMLELAYAYRPDIEAHEYHLKRSRAAVRREYASFAPQIAAFASTSTFNVNHTDFNTDRMLTTVGINASMTLFAGGRRKAELKEARHARRESEWTLVEAERKMAGEVQQALLDLKMAQEALTLNLEAADCVQKNRDLVEKEYRAGKAMLVQLNQAQNDYMQAAGMLAQARVAVQRCWQALHHATGVSLALLTGDPKELSNILLEDTRGDTDLDPDNPKENKDE